MRNELHAKHILGYGGGFFSRFGHLNASAFAAATGVNLRFHDDTPAQLFGCRVDFRHCERDLSPRHRNLILGEDCLALVFMNFHGIPILL